MDFTRMSQESSISVLRQSLTHGLPTSISTSASFSVKVAAHRVDVTAPLTNSSRTGVIPVLSEKMTGLSPWTLRNGYVVTGFISFCYSTLGVGYVPRCFTQTHQPFRCCMFPIYSLSVSLINEFLTSLAGSSCQRMLEERIRSLTPKTCIAGSWTMLPGRSKVKHKDGHRRNDSTLDGPLVSFNLVSALIVSESRSCFFPESAGASALSFVCVL